jgi:hypothetical protein
VAKLTQEELATADLVGKVESKCVGGDHDDGYCRLGGSELEKREANARAEPTHLRRRAGRRWRSRCGGEIQCVSEGYRGWRAAWAYREMKVICLSARRGSAPSRRRETVEAETHQL